MIHSTSQTMMNNDEQERTLRNYRQCGISTMAHHIASDSPEAQFVSNSKEYPREYLINRYIKYNMFNIGRY